MESIKPTTKIEKDKEGNEIAKEFILEDKDYLLIQALRDLTNQIKRLANK